VEAAGIPTISISLSKEVTGKVKPPRAVYTGLPLGHPLGFPGEESQQLKILRQILGYLETIDSPGDLVVIDPTETGGARLQEPSCRN
jgi:D-proline reductase (dithiol) PrdB